MENNPAIQVSVANVEPSSLASVSRLQQFLSRWENGLGDVCSQEKSPNADMLLTFCRCPQPLSFVILLFAVALLLLY